MLDIDIDHRPSRQPIYEPTAPTLNGRIVPKVMLEAARAAKRAGYRVYLTTATPAEGEPGHGRHRHCRNCDGAGVLMLEIATVGPMMDIPAHKRDGDMTIEVPMANPAGRGWYSGTRETYMCPVCQGHPLSKGEL